MTVQTTTATTASRGRRVAATTLEYLGMVVAMLVGMVALDTARHLLLPGLQLRVDVEVLAMLAEMSAGMAAWMAFRRHDGRAITLMCAAMGVPFLVLLPLHWAGASTGDVLMTSGHLLMLPAMALAMPFAHRSGHSGHRSVGNDGSVER